MRLTHPILSFEDLKKDYTKQPVKKVRKGKGGDIVFSQESALAQVLREQVLELLTRHRDVLLELEEAMVKYNQQLIRDFPPIGLMTLKRKTNRGEHEYLNARVMYPLLNDNTIDIRLQLGKKSDYPDLDDNDNQKQIQDKLRLLLDAYLKDMESK